MQHFAQTLMAHVADPARTPEERVEAAFRAWTATAEGAEADAAFAQEWYDQHMAGAVAERSAAHREYIEQRKALLVEWRSSRSPTALRNLVRLKPPAMLEHGIDPLRVYTKNVVVL